MQRRLLVCSRAKRFSRVCCMSKTFCNTSKSQSVPIQRAGEVHNMAGGPMGPPRQPSLNLTSPLHWQSPLLCHNNKPGEWSQVPRLPWGLPPSNLQREEACTSMHDQSSIGGHEMRNHMLLWHPHVPRAVIQVAVYRCCRG